MACKRLSYFPRERSKISFNAMVCLPLGLLGVIRIIRIIRSTADVGRIYCAAVCSFTHIDCSS